MEALGALVPGDGMEEADGGAGTGHPCAGGWDGRCWQECGHWAPRARGMGWRRLMVVWALGPPAAGARKEDASLGARAAPPSSIGTGVSLWLVNSSQRSGLLR